MKIKVKLFFLLLIIVLNSLCSNFIIMAYKIFKLLGINQYSEGMNIIIIKMDIQFIDVLKLEEGSNIENKLVIIFI